MADSAGRSATQPIRTKTKTPPSSSPPPKTLSPGDRVTVIVSHDVGAPDGTFLRDEGYSSQYWTKAEPAPLTFEEVQTLSTRSGGRTQSYGGSASDLDGDGYLDLMVINEITADLRILMNRGDGSGEFDMLEDFVLLDDRASPSETTDFNGDGVVDLVVANLDGDNLSILFGDGSGMLVESQKIDVGEEPRGVAVFDFDGDGDIDIANTNANSDNMSVLLNDGTGQFPETEAAGLTFFDAGHGQADVGTEFGLMAGDMNEDGLLDLVIGARGTGRSGTVVNLGVGDGTFEFGSLSAPATTPWQLAVGDLDGDGHEDVVTADGSLQQSADTVTVLVGDGTGELSDRQIYQERILQPFAIDTGDLDGDGDLDVVVSNFSGDWEVLENDGNGQLSLAQSVESTQGTRGSASCAILMDIDNDGDLDLALIDEIEVVAFTATQIPNITGRRYPAVLAGERYPDGIDIEDEADLAALIRQRGVDRAIFAYSDVSYADIDERRKVVEQAGARFELAPVEDTMLASSKPVIAVVAIRTGCARARLHATSCRCCASEGAGLSSCAIRCPTATWLSNGCNVSPRSAI